MDDDDDAMDTKSSSSSSDSSNNSSDSSTVNRILKRNNAAISSIAATINNDDDNADADDEAFLRVRSANKSCRGAKKKRSDRVRYNRTTWASHLTTVNGPANGFERPTT